MKEVKYKNRVGSHEKLRARKNRKNYKNLDAYLNAVWNNNKEYLNEHVESFGSTKSKRAIWKREVKSYIKNGMNVKQAIDAFNKTSAIVTDEERWGETRLSVMKDVDKAKFDEFRKKVGWKHRLDSSNFVEVSHYNNKNVLVYENPTTGKRTVVIEEISPKSGVVRDFQVMDYLEARKYILEDKIKHKDKDSAALMTELELVKSQLAQQSLTQKAKEHRRNQKHYKEWK